MTISIARSQCRTIYALIEPKPIVRRREKLIEVFNKKYCIVFNQTYVNENLFSN